MYQLKKGQEAFTVVEGPFAGRSFFPGKLYDAVPPGMAGKFEEIKKSAAKKGTDFKSVPVKPAAEKGTDLKSVPVKDAKGGKS